MLSKEAYPMVISSSSIASVQPLQPAKRHGGLRGLANLLRKEHGLWWSTRAWWVHALLWPLIVNGAVVVVAFSFAKEPNTTALQTADIVTTLFFLISGQAAALGAIVTTQGTVVGEKQRGTAAWIMSKPVSRAAFLLSKFVAQAVNVTLMAIVIPSLIFWWQSLILWGI